MVCGNIGIACFTP
ncbi:DUF3265 domain-containing protein [Vibrio parahaemolyticus]|nr:DUF3265 domain-containing protein [Vibrio parahaemolyticus]MDF2292647.1 DUF3265 domain-containing protein [Vibrio parahaemolyticus]MDF2311183.1 DUF3265 domain-containing protein [Vibrio parahaemolyticus]MDF2323882.1 DUF3265 domain-containing protein [Vibrio parahaemolyticus]MDF2328517.1 DUF3265 domain-containing protein [Vibrio parahaemolyticus]